MPAGSALCVAAAGRMRSCRHTFRCVSAGGDGGVPVRGKVHGSCQAHAHLKAYHKVRGAGIQRGAPYAVGRIIMKT